MVVAVTVPHWMTLDNKRSVANNKKAWD